MTPSAKRSLNIIDVKSPCDEPWLDMEVAGPNKRSCALCMQDVYDLSAMTTDEAEALIFESTGRVCIRFFRRADGTVVTSDCSPVRFRQLRQAGQSGLRMAGKVIGAVVALLTLLGFARFAGINPFGLFADPMMGEMAVQGAVGAEPFMGEVEEYSPPHSAPSDDGTSDDGTSDDGTSEDSRSQGQ